MLARKGHGDAGDPDPLVLFREQCRLLCRSCRWKIISSLCFALNNLHESVVQTVAATAPLVIAIAKTNPVLDVAAAARNLLSPVVSVLSVPSNIVASATAKAIKIDKKLVAKAKRSILRTAAKIIWLFSRPGQPLAEPPTQVTQYEYQTMPDAPFNYSDPKAFSCLSNENATATTLPSGGELLCTPLRAINDCLLA